MEEFQGCLLEANKAMRTADHLVYVTYPFVNDVKLIMTIAENLHKALVNGLNAMLSYEYLYKRINTPPRDFKEKIEVFKSFCVPRYNIPRESLLLISDINNLIDHRRNSPTEFIKSGKFVMCTQDFKMRILNFEKVKGYNTKVKEFINKINEILR